MEIEVKKVKLSSIKLNKDNPRRISDADMERLVKSINEFPEMMSLREIVVDETMTVLGGNMRTLALRKTGEKECTAKIVKGLTEAQKREFVIKDNGSMGEWDFDLLANGWSDLPLDDWGVDLPEDWLNAGSDAEVTEGDAEPQIDRAEELNKIWQVKRGDLFSIGEHRLLCGDSTKADDVARVMGGEKPLVMITDPPYGVKLDQSWRDKALGSKAMGPGNKNIVENDEQADWTPAWALFGGDIAYIWHAGRFSDVVMMSLRNVGLEPCQQLIWNKSVMVMGRSDYHFKHEPCWYAVRKGKPHLWSGDRTQTTVIEAKSPNHIMSGSSEEKTEHPTQKPIDCFMMIQNHSSPVVYDPFLGSGTAMVACSNVGRKCIGLEISPDYCAVILQRMTDAFPGIEIKRISE